MPTGFRSLVSVIKDNPDFIPTALSKSSVSQLVRGVIISMKYADSIAGVIPGTNTSVLVDDGSIHPNGHIVIGTSGPGYLRDRGTMLCIEEGTFESTTDDILYIGKGTTIYVNGGSLQMGKVQAFYGCEIYCTNEVTIGDRCGIGPGVVIRDGHPHSLQASGEDRTTSAPIVIEDGAILPGQTVVKKGVTIGEGAVVASGSVVTKDVPPHTLAAGVPAEVIETDVNWEY